MSNLTLHHDSNEPAVPLPQPRVQIAVREAMASDLPFIDALQKKHSKMVGWFPTKQIEANIRGGHVLVAVGSQPSAVGRDGEADGRKPRAESPLGYCIARDTYMKREDCGIVYQLNVTPGEHRKLVGATLIKAVFDRAAYGCKLFCCWCAQDIDANYFWESIGFVPLAFRTGSRRGSKSSGGGPRIHIFWQRRIREGDDATPYWFPSQTMGGAVREGRIVLPIPPGTHWSDAKPAVLPGLPANKATEQWQLPGHSREGGNPDGSDKPTGSPPARGRRKEKPVQVQHRNSIAAGGLRFGPPLESSQKRAAKKAKASKPKVRFKNDPQYIAAARELRDRYLEQANDAGSGLLPGACGKYDVSRAIEHAPTNFRGVMKDGSEPGVPGVPGARLLDAA